MVKSGELREGTRRGFREKGGERKGRREREREN
jgi:hypothetical protein